MTTHSAGKPDYRGLPRGQLLFLAALVLAGLFFLGQAAIHALWPTAPPSDLTTEVRSYLAEREVRPLSAPLNEVLSAPASSLAQTMEHPLFGHAAPAFELAEPTGRRLSLKDLTARGPVVVVFYYGYWCNHCVAQLFAINQDIARFRELGAEVVAISGDPPETTRERFRQYGTFAFPVLSDAGNRVARAYGVAKPAVSSDQDDLLHGTFVISRDGIVRWVNVGDTPFTDNRTLLHELAAVEGKLPQ
jgi:peroxiredoxin